MDRRLTLLNLNLSRYIITALRRHLQALAVVSKKDPRQARAEVDRFVEDAVGRTLTDAEWDTFSGYLGPQGDDLRREVSGKIIEYPLVTGVRQVAATTAALDYNLAAIAEIVRDLVGADPSDSDKERLVDFLSRLVEAALNQPAEHDHVH